jgi:hypothetical protein
MKENGNASRRSRRDRLIPLVPREAGPRAAFVRSIVDRLSKNGGSPPKPGSADWPGFEEAILAAFGSIYVDVQDRRVTIAEH